MARTVNPARHAARRLTIIDAALTCFAEHGYDRATTTMICRAADIGSGTFFHYFPTKLDVLLETLRIGTAETTAWFAAQAARDDPRGVIDDFLRRTAAEFADPRIGGFVRAVGAVMGVPEVAAALEDDERATMDGLLPWVRLARDRHLIRSDLSAERLVAWLMVVLDGVLSRAASETGFAIGDETEVLRDVVDRLLAPAGR